MPRKKKETSAESEPKAVQAVSAESAGPPELPAGESATGSTTATEAAALPPLEPAEMPAGFLNQVNYLISNPGRVLESIRRDHQLWELSRTLMLIVAGMGAAYGLVMGGTNWLQGAGLPFNIDLLLMLVVAIKVPCLFLITLVIVAFPIYVSGTLLGARASFSQVVALLLASTGVTATVLASMASVALFFSLTTLSYSFMKLLHVLFFAYAGIAGLSFLTRGYRLVSGYRTGKAQNAVFALWLVLYAFVGTQLAWVMRPFVGAPNMPFTLFRPRSGNFYEAVWDALVRTLGG